LLLYIARLNLPCINLAQNVVLRPLNLEIPPLFFYLILVKSSCFYTFLQIVRKTIVDILMSLFSMTSCLFSSANLHIA